MSVIALTFEVDVSDWHLARGFHHGPELPRLHTEAGDTSAVGPYRHLSQKIEQVLAG
jgi:hypothetical protein